MTTYLLPQIQTSERFSQSGVPAVLLLFTFVKWPINPLRSMLNYSSKISPLLKKR